MWAGACFREPRVSFSAHRQIRRVIETEERLGIGILENVSNLRCLQQYVDGDDDGPSLEHAEIDYREIRYVRTRQRHMVSLADPVRLETVCHLIRRSVQLRICENLVCEQNRVLLWV